MIDMAKTNAARLREYRQRQKAKGLKRYEIWLDEDAVEVLEYNGVSESPSDFISYVLCHWYEFGYRLPGEPSGGRIARRHKEAIEKGEPTYEAERKLMHGLRRKLTVTDRPITRRDFEGRRDILEFYILLLDLSGYGPSKIARIFNSHSIPTISGKGKWERGTVGNLLRRFKNEREYKDSRNDAVEEG